MKIYFAHSMRDYGKPAAIEARVTIQKFIDLSKTKPHEILDPEQMNFQDIVWKQGSYDAAYRWVVEQADIVIALEHQGHVGRGVFTELSLALELKKPTFVVRSGNLVKVASVTPTGINDWKVRYGTVQVAS